MRESRADFGKELAKLRAEKGVSLEDMAAAIKVRAGLVKALEDGLFEALPPAIFVEGYLKAYAHHLGVEPAPILARYRALVPAPAAQPKVQAPAPVLEEETRGPGWLKWIVLVAALAAAGYGAYILKGRMEPVAGEEVASRTAAQAPTVQEPAREAPSEVLPSTSAPAPQQEPAADPTGGAETPQAGPSAATAAPAPVPEPPAQQAPAQQESPAPQAPVQAQEPPPAGDLVLTASAPCWCELWADGKRVLYRMVTPGERLGFRGASFKASVGNAGAVDLVFRGHPVPLPREQGIVVKDLAIPASPGGGAP